MLPGPDVQLVTRWEAIAIRAAIVMKQLPEQRWRRVLGVPVRRDHEIFHGDAVQLPVLWLLHEQFRTLRVQLPVTDQRGVAAVDAHRTRLRSADAHEGVSGACRRRLLDGLEALGRGAYRLDERSCWVPRG